MDADELYKKAYGAVERGNPDYAIELLMQILDFFPDHVQARKSLRATVIRKVEAAGYTRFTSVKALVKGLDTIFKMYFLQMQKRYDKAMVECERYLLADPKAIWVLKVLGDCARKAGHEGAAQVAFENILTVNKKHPGALEGLARMCEARGDFEQAHKYLARLKVTRPNDRTIEKWMRDLAAKQTMQAGQWEKTETDFRAKLKDKEASVVLEEKQHLVRTDEDVEKAIERLQADLNKTPGDNRLWRELGDMYRRRRAFAKAFDAYNQCLKNDPNDFTAKAKIGDMKIQQFDENMEKLEAGIKSGQAAAEATDQLNEIRKERLAFAVTEFRRRVKAMPTDLGLKFELGILLLQGGVIDEAIANFQAAIEDAKLKVDAHLELGACFILKGQHEMALRQFSLANDAIPAMNRKKREALYQMAMASKAAGKPQDARNYLMQIYEVDISFKDVAKQLEALGQKAT